MTISGTSMVSLTIDGQLVNMTWHDLMTQMTKNECVGGVCRSSVASANALDLFYYIFGGCLVFFMILGFAMLEIGCCHVKNTKHILMRNLGDLCISAITFYAFGYAFAFLDGNAFIGDAGFFLQGKHFTTSEDPSKEYDGLQYASWFFQWAICAVCVTIFSGAVAERITLFAYFCFSLLVSGFIYPIAAHWIWAETGWASAFNTTNLLFGVGVIDYAGCGVIHMIGGTAALVGCLMVGPRNGRFRSDGTHTELPKQSVLYQSMGTLILWFGWYGFNCVSTFSLRGNNADVMAKVAVNLTISAAMGGLFTVFWDKLYGSKTFDPCMGNNGILAGCVAVTGCCAVIEPESAIALGFISSIVYVSLSKLIVRFKIDDVVDAIPVHLGCGTLGALAPGFFASAKGVRMFYNGASCGVFYTCNGNSGKQLGAQIVYVLAVFGWMVVFCYILFSILKSFKLLRSSPEAEAMGLDSYEHGGLAIDFHVPTKPTEIEMKAQGSVKERSSRDVATASDVRLDISLHGLRERSLHGTPYSVIPDTPAKEN